MEERKPVERRHYAPLWVGILLFFLYLVPLEGAEILRLGPDNWDLVPQGKEVDAIYGDYLIRNDRVVAVIGAVAPGRNAHMSCRNIQGAVIDFTLRSANNDQLTAFFPHGDTNPLPAANRAEVITAQGTEVHLRVVREPTERDPVEIFTDYFLRDGEPFLRVVTHYRNTSLAPVSRRILDKIRCDQTFLQSPEGAFDFVYFYDKWFHSAYGVACPQGKIYTNGRYGGMFGPLSGTLLEYPNLFTDPTNRTTQLQPQQEIVLTRYLLTGNHLGELQFFAYQALQQPVLRVTAQVLHRNQPVKGVDIEVKQKGQIVSMGYTEDRGTALLGLPPGLYTITASQIGRSPTEKTVEVTGDTEVLLEVGPQSKVAFEVKDEKGRPIPCKVQFIGIGDTPEPYLGPDQRANGCRNLFFSAQGEFEVPLPPGQYYLVISHGPEYNAEYRYLNLAPGRVAKVSARLARVVNSKGWISADFHNHSSESGDNTTEPESRILCLVAEGIEFAPSTEHNRIQTYRHRLKALGLEKILATSDGIELTGSPFPLNHQNAFPLLLRFGQQDNGAPLPDPNPRVQIQRLYEHDNRSEKLVQQNHPDIGWLFFDKNGDGQPDEGFGTYPFTHVIEVWATNILDMQPTTGTPPNLRNNRIFNWLQLLNLGYRLPGVANTDAHYCFHQSGVIRNYVKVSADDPAKVKEMEVVRSARKGRIVMTNGPFMEVSLNGAYPGDDLRLPKGEGTLKIRVECPNWLDIDRVQVLVNGRPDPQMNFTRSTHPHLFKDGVVKFNQKIKISLKQDAHIIVVAIGSKASLGPVMGPHSDPPLAISNPIFVDVDGDGFQPNKDLLDAPLPTKRS